MIVETMSTLSGIIKSVQIKFDNNDDIYQFDIYRLYIITNLKKYGSTLSSTLNNKYYTIPIDDNTTLKENSYQLTIYNNTVHHCIYKFDNFIFDPNFKGLLLVNIADQDDCYDTDDDDVLVGYSF